MLRPRASIGYNRRSLLKGLKPEVNYRDFVATHVTNPSGGASGLGLAAVGGNAIIHWSTALSAGALDPFDATRQADVTSVPYANSHMFNIPRGTSRQERIGNHVRVISAQLNLMVKWPSYSGTNPQKLQDINVAVVRRGRPETSGTVKITPSEVYDDTFVPRRVMDHIRDYKVIWKGVIRAPKIDMEFNSPNYINPNYTKTLTKYMKLREDVHFKDSSTGHLADLKNGEYQTIIWHAGGSTSSVPDPEFVAQLRIRFIDA